MATANMLETLPTELKLALLENIPDVLTLSRLVHASPDYHQVYLAYRELILTKATLRGLGKVNFDCSHALGRNRIPVSLSFSIMQDFQTAITGVYSKDLILAIISCQTQFQSRGFASIRLTVEQCTWLGRLDKCCVFSRSLTDHDPPGWANRDSAKHDFWECVSGQDLRSELMKACIFVFGEGSPFFG